MTQSQRVLVVEDDERFAETVAGELRDRGYEVDRVADLSELRDLSPLTIHFALVDLRLRRDNGLDAIAVIRESSPDARVIVLTGYGSIATAVQAVKMGADNYLTKPVDIDDIERAFKNEREPDVDEGEDEGEGENDGNGEDVPLEISAEFQTLARHEREYIEYVLAESGGNISQAARRLGLHRQSLQRKLRKYTPR